MYRQKLTVLTIIWFLGMSRLFSYQNHPLLAINEKFIPLEKKNRVSPYMTMIYALDLLRYGGHNDMVKRFIQWYVDHINRIDCFGVSGTVYDYSIDLHDGKEYSYARYDSADGYAGMFLYLVADYYEKSGDKQFIEKIFPALKDTVYLIYHLRDSSDGLVKALPFKNYQIKYLMDNVESWMGLKAYISLARVFGREDENQQIKAYTSFQNELKSAILSQLYNSSSGLFAWAKEGDKRYESVESVFYPDMFAQMHILAFWGEQMSKETAQNLWQKIKALIHRKAVNMEAFRQERGGKYVSGHDPKIAMEQLIIFERAKAFALKNNL